VPRSWISALLVLSASAAIADAPQGKPATDAPWQAGIDKYMDGDLIGALQLEDACAERKLAKCKAKASQMRTFVDMYKTLDDLDDNGLSKLQALDKAITDGQRSKLARTAGIKLSAHLCEKATAAKSAGQWRRAGELAQQALDADPGDPCAASIVQDMKGKQGDLQDMKTRKKQPVGDFPSDPPLEE